MAHRHFEADQHAQLYAKYRPSYPEQLFARLVDFTSKQALLGCAVDVGCGSGQSTFGLAPHFTEVIGFDPSKAQIAQATSTSQQANVRFGVATAEQMPLPASSADLITVAQALHWLDFEAFYRECDRVLRPGGVIAAYGYGLIRFCHPLHAKALNDVIDVFYKQTIEDNFWDNRRSHIDNAYTAPELQIPYADKYCRDDTLVFTNVLSVREVIMYLSTWSAYQAKLKVQPETQCLQEINARLLQVLGETSDIDAKLGVYYPLFLLLGRKPTS